MSRYIDITGQKFNSLTAIERVGKSKSGNSLWKCKCDCGNESVVNISNLRNGKVKSCGCLAVNNLMGNRYRETHNMSRTRLYYIWQGMKQRCLGQGTGSKYYNGRGITYCPEWESFENFRDWALSNGYSKNLTIDRKDVDGDYEPSNCRWISTKQQNRNKTSTIFLTLNGEARSMGEWSEILGIPMSTMVNRRNRGLSVEQILSTKYLSHKNKRWGC